MKNILFGIYITVTVVIIALHSQTIPFILMVALSIMLWVIYSRQRKKQSSVLAKVTEQKDIATIQLKSANANPDSQLLFNALAGIQTQIIKKEIDNNKPLNLRLALPLFSETRYVMISDILRCEADNTYTTFRLIDGEQIMVSKTLKEFADILVNHGFVRAHQSHLVNITHIKSWLREDGGCLLLTDQTKIPVSKLNREKVKDALTGSIKS